MISSEFLKLIRKATKASKTFDGIFRYRDSAFEVSRNKLFRLESDVEFCDFVWGFYQIFTIGKFLERLILLVI